MELRSRAISGRTESLIDCGRSMLIALTKVLVRTLV